MGVNDTIYPRLTIYLKKEQINFLNKVVSSKSGPKSSPVNKSELIRALLDEYAGTVDWNTKSLLGLMNKSKKPGRNHKTGIK